MAAQPMLDGVALQQVQEIHGVDAEVLNRHQVPGLEGDFLQDFGRRAIRIRLNGTMTGPGALAGLDKLRTKFRGAKPVPFVADIATATKVTKVVIQEMGIREVAGKPGRFEYSLTLVESIFPKQPATVTPKLPVPALPKAGTGALKLEVSSREPIDVKRSTAILQGITASGRTFWTTLEPSGNGWSGAGVPPGRYTASVVLTDPPLTGKGEVTIRPAQLSRIEVTPKPGVTVARAFIVHFALGSAFVEPAMMPVLKLAAEYAKSHPSEKLLVAGHTDPIGSMSQNQALSEERARAVYACLVSGAPLDARAAEWRKIRRASSRDPVRSWGRREYQLMLRDLGYFQGQIDNDAKLSSSAVRAFQLDNAVGVEGLVDDATWNSLVHEYFAKNALSVAENRFLDPPWCGFADQIPVEATGYAARRNRRVELLFVRPGTSPQSRRRWALVPAELGRVIVRGSIRLEDGTPAQGLSYVLIAPDGQCMDGELPAGPERGRPVAGRTAEDGTFAYPDGPNQIGIYTLEVLEPLLARQAGEPRSAARGPFVVKRLDSLSTFDVMLSQR